MRCVNFFTIIQYSRSYRLDYVISSQLIDLDHLLQARLFTVPDFLLDCKVFVFEIKFCTGLGLPFALQMACEKEYLSSLEIYTHITVCTTLIYLLTRTRKLIRSLSGASLGGSIQFPALIFGWVLITTLYQLMLQ